MFRLFLVLIFFIAALASFGRLTSQHENDDDLEEQNCTSTSSSIFKIVSSHEILYSGFNSSTELHIFCDIMTYETSLSTVFLSIVVDFSTVKIMRDPLDISVLGQFLQSSSLVIKGLLGFDVEMNNSILLVDSYSDWNHYNRVQFVDSEFDFYYRGYLVDAKLCREDIFETSNALFGRLESVNLLSMVSVSFKNPICPLVFKNAQLYSISTVGFEKNRLSENHFSFLTVNTTNLHASIIELYFTDFYDLEVTDQIIDKLVFNSIQRLGIVGDLGKIQADLFKSFNSLKYFKILTNHAADFFHLSYNEWLSSLFFQGREFESASEKMEFMSQNNQSHFHLQVVDLANYYQPGDKDFCLFKHFAYKRAILFQLTFYHIDYYSNWDPIGIESCTLKFLSQNIKIFQAKTGSELDSIVNDLDKCNIAEKLLSCNISSVSIHERSNFYFDKLDLVYLFKWSEYIGPIITFSIVAAFGFLLNLTTILVIKREKDKKLFESKIFTFILMNSGFNCVECLIYQLKLLSKCLGVNSLFCSSVMSSYFVQYIAIYFTGFLGEVMKSCSILASLFFSLQRYIEASGSKNSALKTFNRLNVFKLTGINLTISTLTSVIKIFNYDISSYRTLIEDQPNNFNINFSSFQRFWFLSFFYFLHYAFNDSILLLINLIIDIQLVRSIKKDLIEKIEAKTSLFGEKSHTASSNSKLQRDLKHKQKVEKKANVLVLSSLAVYIICRVPELLGSVFVYLGQGVGLLVTTCLTQQICYLVDESIEYLYMLSYSINVLFYYNFNSNFKKGFRRFLGFKVNRTI